MARALTWLRLLYERDGDARAAEPALAALLAPPERLASLLGESEMPADFGPRDSEALDSFDAVAESIGRQVERHVRAFLRLRREGEATGNPPRDESTG